MPYLWQHKKWPRFSWRSRRLLPLVSETRRKQGRLFSRVSNLGFQLNLEAYAHVLTEEAIKTSAIEGEYLNPESVRSSVAQHLGLPTAGLPRADQSVNGLVEVLLDATKGYDKSLNSQRIKRWQAALNPTGQSGLVRVRTGKWRHPKTVMQVVSGAYGREKIHYEAPPGKRVEKEMKQFLSWWKKTLRTEDGLLRSGLAHLYFVTIHPFDDGNGRIARALTDMALAQDEKLETRYYSFSSQIMDERAHYYSALEVTQKSDLDVTEWLAWYLSCLGRAVDKAEHLIERVLEKARFWQRLGVSEINDGQRKVLTKLLDAGKEGIRGGLTTRKYVAMTKVSRATAFREISNLVEKGALRQNPAQGRSTSYDINWI